MERRIWPWAEARVARTLDLYSDISPVYVMELFWRWVHSTVSYTVIRGTSRKSWIGAVFSLKVRVYSTSHHLSLTFSKGSPKNYAKLEKKRPLAILVNAMVCAEAQTLHWVEGKSIATSGAWELMSDDFRRIKFADMTDEKVQNLPTVECVRLTDILGRFGIYHVDLFSLDVEGAELSVLKAIDFDKFSASVILVEERSGSQSVIPLLTNAGYVRDKGLGPNNVFLHPDFKKSITGNFTY